MRFNPTEKLLLACASTAGKKEQIDLLLNEHIDWEYLIKLAKTHRIILLLYHNLKNKRIPETIKKELKDIYTSNLIESLRLEAEREKIFKLFNGQGIDCVPLKGTVFARDVYGDIALRQTADIDVLVRENDLFRVKELLLNNGFQRVGLSDQYYLKESCHLVFSNGRCMVEAHWNIGPYNKIKVPAEYLWQKVCRQAEGLRLSPDMTLVFMLLKFNFDSFFSLRYLVDIAATLRRFKTEINWNKFEQSLKRYRAQQLFCLALRLIEEFFEEKYCWEEMDFAKPSFFRKMLLNAFPAEQMVRDPGYKRAWRILFMDDYREAVALVRGYWGKELNL